jgi:hypothetical protein
MDTGGNTHGHGVSWIDFCLLAGKRTCISLGISLAFWVVKLGLCGTQSRHGARWLSEHIRCFWCWKPLLDWMLAMDHEHSVFFIVIRYPCSCIDVIDCLSDPQLEKSHHKTFLRSRSSHVLKICLAAATLCSLCWMWGPCQQISQSAATRSWYLSCLSCNQDRRRVICKLVYDAVV